MRLNGFVYNRIFRRTFEEQEWDTLSGAAAGFIIGGTYGVIHGQPYAHSLDKRLNMAMNGLVVGMPALVVGSFTGILWPHLLLFSPLAAIPMAIHSHKHKQTTNK